MNSNYSRPKILAVDDIPANLIMLRALLDDVDADIDEATNGNEALALALDNEYALILLDVQMPDMDGFEVAAILRTHDHTKKTPIIFITALSHEIKYQAKGYSVGAVDYLSKPLNPSFLMTKVDVFLELYKQKQEIAIQQRKTEITLSAIPDPVLTVVGDDITYLNEPAKALSRIFGHKTDCTSLIDLFGFNEENLLKIQCLVNLTSQNSAHNDAHLELTFSLKGSGSNMVYEFSLVPLQGLSNSEPEVVLIFHDVSNNRALSKELSHQAFHDPLTNLPNRRFLVDAFDAALARKQRNKKHVVILMIDLDDFKTINDTAGHQAGDLALIETADRVQSCLRDADIFCRLGGDEFCILMENIESIDEIEFPVKRILESLRQPFAVNKDEYLLSASIGITSTLLNNDYNSLDMMSDADMALYKAKERGKGQFCLFEPDMRLLLEDKLRLDKELMSAIARKEFVLYYQPQANVDTGELCGMEALIRWNHPQRGIVGPDDFLDVLESTGMIKTVGAWVISEAVAQIKTWQDDGLNVPCVSVNVSPKQFNEKGLIGHVHDTLAKHNVEATLLGIEITENLFMELTSQVESNLKVLSNLGCKIALDDFGTGYSSLSYLLRFPINTIKIDKAFITHLNEKPEYLEMVKAIIRLAHGFNGMTVISEGVEDLTSLELLREIHCDMFQGYYLDKPITAVEMKTRLSKR